MSTSELQLKLDIINRITELKEVRVIKEIKKLLDFELEENLYEFLQIKKIELQKQERNIKTAIILLMKKLIMKLTNG